MSICSLVVQTLGEGVPQQGSGKAEENILLPAAKSYLHDAIPTILENTISMACVHNGFTKDSAALCYKLRITTLEKDGFESFILKLADKSHVDEGDIRTLKIQIDKAKHKIRTRHHTLSSYNLVPELLKKGEPPPKVRLVQLLLEYRQINVSELVEIATGLKIEIWDFSNRINQLMSLLGAPQLSHESLEICFADIETLRNMCQQYYITEPGYQRVSSSIDLS